MAYAFDLWIEWISPESLPAGSYPDHVMMKRRVPLYNETINNDPLMPHRNNNTLIQSLCEGSFFIYFLLFHN